VKNIVAGFFIVRIRWHGNDVSKCNDWHADWRNKKPDMEGTCRTFL